MHGSGPCQTALSHPCPLHRPRLPPEKGRATVVDSLPPQPQSKDESSLGAVSRVMMETL